MYKCMTIIVSYLIVMMQAVRAEQMSVSDLIDRYETTQAKIRAFSAKGVDTGQVIMPDGSTFYYREESVLHSDEDRAHWRCRQWRGLNSADEATPVERATNRVYLWDGDSSYEYRKERDIHGQLFIAGHDKVKKAIISIGYGGAPLMGILEGDLDPVGSILRQAETISVRPEQEQVGKSFCYVIDAITDHGHYTVWMDPQHGYNIAKAQVHKKQGDMAWGKPVGWMGDLSKVRMPRKPKRLRSFSFTLKNIRFENINGVWVPMEADYETTKDRTGDVSVRKTHYRRTHFEREPDFDAIGAFVLDIPNGTRVWILYAPGIRYEWQDGKPVTVVDESFLKDLDNEIEKISADAEPPIKVPSKQRADANGQEAKIFTPEAAVTNTAKVPGGAKSESRSFVVLMLVIMFIVGITGYLVFFKLRTKKP